MRRAFAIIVSAAVLAACNSAGTQESAAAPSSGSATQRSYNVGAFDAVSLAGHYNVVVAVGSAPSVRAEESAEQLDKLEIEVRDNRLRIGTKRGNWRFSGEPATVYVTAPRLSAASIGGSGDMRIDRVEGGDFAASIGGSGDMEIGTMRVSSAGISIAGSGNVSASGSADRATYSIAGSGDVNAPALQSRTADITVVGSGNVRARATEAASVSVMGSGDVELTGGARCDVSKMGSGDVRCERG